MTTQNKTTADAIGSLGKAMLGLFFIGGFALFMIAIGVAIIIASGWIGAATFGVLALGTLLLLVRKRRSAL